MLWKDGTSSRAEQLVSGGSEGQRGCGAQLIARGGGCTASPATVRPGSYAARGSAGCPARARLWSGPRGQGRKGERRSTAPPQPPVWAPGCTGGTRMPGRTAGDTAFLLCSSLCSTKGASAWAVGRSCAWGHPPTHSRRAGAHPVWPWRAPAAAGVTARAGVPRSDRGRAAAAELAGGDVEERSRGQGRRGLGHCCPHLPPQSWPGRPSFRAASEPGRARPLCSLAGGSVPSAPWVEFLFRTP